jgi:hypothetical protein
MQTAAEETACRPYSTTSKLSAVVGHVTVTQLLQTPRCRILLEKLIITHLVNKFHAIYETRRIITVFTRACHWSLSWATCQRIRPSPRPCVTFRNMLVFYGEKFLCPHQTSQTRRPHLVGCPQLLIQYIRSYPPYLETVSSIYNPKMRHAVVTRSRLT